MALPALALEQARQEDALALDVTRLPSVKVMYNKSDTLYLPIRSFIVNYFYSSHTHQFFHVVVAYHLSKTRTNCLHNCLLDFPDLNLVLVDLLVVDLQLVQQIADPLLVLVLLGRLVRLVSGVCT